MASETATLDKSLTEFKKVSDLSGTSLDNYVQKLSQLGQTVARTASEMVDSATEFRKSGFSDDDAAQLAQIAEMYRNVADESLSSGDAASFIISQMKAYGIEAQNAMHIIDAVNEVSNNFAVSSSDIATNIGKASAALANGNVTYEESIGLMTAITEINRNGAKSARGLVSIQSRYNQILDDTSSTGKKLTDWYEEHGIELYDSQTGQLRSLFDVLSDLSQKWDGLTDNERKYFANIQAGANQSQQLLSLMLNFDTALDATATAYDATGSAMRENERYMESIEA